MINLIMGTAIIGGTLVMLGIHGYGVLTGIRGFKGNRRTGGFDVLKADRILTAVLGGEIAYYALGLIILLTIAFVPTLVWIMAIMLLIHTVTMVGINRFRILSSLRSEENWIPRLRRFYASVGIFDGVELLILLYVLLLLYPVIL